MHAEIVGNELHIVVESESETDRLGAALAGVVVAGTVLALIGPLGAGKTRLTRALAEAMGADPLAIASPTFVLIHEYEARIPIFHFDAYRLAGPSEFEAIGADEYFDGRGVCVVEWADRVLDCLPPRRWAVRIQPEGLARRIVGEFPDDPAIAVTLLGKLRIV